MVRPVSVRSITISSHTRVKIKAGNGGTSDIVTVRIPPQARAIKGESSLRMEMPLEGCREDYIEIAGDLEGCLIALDMGRRVMEICPVGSVPMRVRVEGRVVTENE